jgi:4-diphosphocytidyl-2-C-methyl-D-erythritol kinase
LRFNIPYMKYLSPCKINLGLEVLSKRDDGYHNINTVFYKLSEPQDELLIEEASEFLFTCDNSEIPTSDNVIIKALKLCSESSGLSLPKLHIHLSKKIPRAAGLGGGSANAATAIKIYSELCKRISEEKMFAIGRKLGADVPFFLFHSDAAVASEIGDKLRPITFELPWPILIIKLRDTYISTAKAYEMLWLKKRDEPSDFNKIFSLHKEPRLWREVITNDFEEPAFALYPILFSLKRSLYESGAEFALMSGSGSAFYGIYTDQQKAGLAREKLLMEYREADVFLSGNS